MQDIPVSQSGSVADYTSGVKEAASDTVTFSVRVHPRARRNSIDGKIGDALKVSLTAPPVDGKANEAVIRFFAELLQVPRSSVTIAAGETSRNKVIRVVGLTPAELNARLAAAT